MKFTPDYTSPPGHTIIDLNEHYEYNSEYVSNKLEITKEQYRRLLNGIHPIDNNLAEMLGVLYKTSTGFWIAREQHYRDALIRLGEK